MKKNSKKRKKENQNETELGLLSSYRLRDFDFGALATLAALEVAVDAFLPPLAVLACFA